MKRPGTKKWTGLFTICVPTSGITVYMGPVLLFVPRSYRRRERRGSFTLVELLITVVLITLLAAMSLTTLYSVLEVAKERRTQAQVEKLSSMIMRLYDDYRSRPVRLPALPSDVPGNRGVRAGRRLLAIRELMRMELPDRITDVFDDPVVLTSRPSLSRAYVRAVRGTFGIIDNSWYQNPQSPGQTITGIWSVDHQGAECLYLIISMIRDGRSSGLDFFTQSEIGDVDQDGMYEILDAWGRPIEWLRWAPGFATIPGPDGGWGNFNVDDDGDGVVDGPSERGWPGSDDASELQSRDLRTYDTFAVPDPFDPLRVDPRWRTPPDGFPNFVPYALVPLVFSAGKDGEYHIQVDFDTNSSTGAHDMFRYSTTPLRNDPYYLIPALPITMFGRAYDIGADDNITNHLLDAG